MSVPAALAIVALVLLVFGEAYLALAFVIVAALVALLR